MEHLIPLPTDNLYKFCALFGLLLFMFSIGGQLYVVDSTNSLVFETGVEYVTLASTDNRTVQEEARFSLMERKLEIARSDRRTAMVALSGVLALGMWMIGYGFRKWFKVIQPIQDEMARLTLKKLRVELGEEESI